LQSLLKSWAEAVAGTASNTAAVMMRMAFIS
jgi:hypothetical protein